MISMRNGSGFGGGSMRRLLNSCADALRRDRRGTTGPDGFLNLLGEQGQGVLVDRAAPDRLPDAGNDLVAAEWLGRAAPLGGVRDPLVDVAKARLGLGDA